VSVPTTGRELTTRCHVVSRVVVLPSQQQSAATVRVRSISHHRYSCRFLCRVTIFYLDMITSGGIVIDFRLCIVLFCGACLNLKLEQV
jgi:hypothetical protein